MGGEMKKLIIALMILILAAFAGCKKKDYLSSEDIKTILDNVKSTPVEPVLENEVAVIETDYGKIVFSFYTEQAPNHSSNFKRLARAGYFDGTTFHRVVPDFVIQGGDILTRDGDRLNDGTGGPGYTIDAEFSDLPHKAGSVGMARSQDVNSAGSQFYIALRDLPNLDGKYTVFGQVIQGFDVVQRIARVETDERDNPVRPVLMNRVYVTTRDLLGL
jgi:cyclophilin family peptidyl-prolyl cis-trans isomerase